MPFPLLVPLVSFVAKATLSDLIVTTVVATTAANVANDGYQKLKENAHSSDDDKLNRN